MFPNTILFFLPKNSIIKSVIVADKSGLTKFTAKTFIDASGDADLVALSGAEYVLGSQEGDLDALVGEREGILGRLFVAGIIRCFCGLAGGKAKHHSHSQ